MPDIGRLLFRVPLPGPGRRRGVTDAARANSAKTRRGKGMIEDRRINRPRKDHFPWSMTEAGREVMRKARVGAKSGRKPSRRGGRIFPSPTPPDRGTLAKTRPVRFGKRPGKPVRVMTTTLRKVKRENRRLYEDLTYGPPGSGSRRPGPSGGSGRRRLPKPPRRVGK